jgi:hypothetical protein
MTVPAKPRTKPAGNGHLGEAPPPADLEKLAAELVRKLGPARARYLAALLDEAAEAAEEGKT